MQGFRMTYVTLVKRTLRSSQANLHLVLGSLRPSHLILSTPSNSGASPHAIISQRTPLRFCPAWNAVFCFVRVRRAEPNA